MGRSKKTSHDDEWWSYSRNATRYPDLPITHKDGYQTKLRRLASKVKMTERQQRFLSMHICHAPGTESYITLEEIAKDMELSLDAVVLLDEWAREKGYIKTVGIGCNRLVTMNFLREKGRNKRNDTRGKRFKDYYC